MPPPASCSRRAQAGGAMATEPSPVTTGRPVIAARVGAIPEVVRDGETAILVPPRDAAALRAAMASLISDRAKRDALAVAGSLHQAQFSWSAAAERVAAIYRRVLA